MLRTKACPRCHGDIVQVADRDERYLSCVQCGFVLYASSAPRTAFPTASR